MCTYTCMWIEKHKYIKTILFSCQCDNRSENHPAERVLGAQVFHSHPESTKRINWWWWWCFSGQTGISRMRAHKCQKTCDAVQVGDSVVRTQRMGGGIRIRRNNSQCVGNQLHYLKLLLPDNRIDVRWIANALMSREHAGIRTWKNIMPKRCP